MNGNLDAPPRVSVVVPTYNRSQCLMRCLEALASQELPREEFEVIVVDDGSSDATLEVCELFATRLRMKVYRQENRGPAAARNAGIRLAAGRLIAFTDDDCIPPRDWLTRILRHFERDPELVGVGGVMVTPLSEWVPLCHRSDLPAAGSAAALNFIGTNNAAYGQAALVAVGGFDESFRHVSVEDADLYLRVRRLGKTLLDPSLFVLHPPRPQRLREAVRGFVAFYRGYLALRNRYPKEFPGLYGGSPERAAILGRNLGTRLKGQVRGILRHPIRGLQFLAYLLISRAAVVGLYLAARLRRGGFSGDVRGR